MDKILLEKMRREFRILIDRCSCSRASLIITPEEAKLMSEIGISVSSHVPNCTPEKCFPNLYKFLYPNGGFNQKSDLAKRKRKVYFKLIKERK